MKDYSRNITEATNLAGPMPSWIHLVDASLGSKSSVDSVATATWAGRNAAMCRLKHLAVFSISSQRILQRTL